MSKDSTPISAGRATWSAPVLEPLDIDLASVAATNTPNFNDGATTANKKRATQVS